MKKMLGATLLAAAGAAAVPAQALADDGMTARFSGFGTLGAVRTNTDDAQFVTGPWQSHGAGKEWDFGVDSNLGLQANLQFNPMFSAVGQVLTTRRQGSDKPWIEWLFGQAAVTDWLDLRAGRMVLPVFMVSDSRAIGYASHWVRQPVDVYALYPSASFDGFQARNHFELAGGNVNIQLSLGRAKATMYTGYPFPMNEFQARQPKIRGLNVTYERGDWTLRVGQTQSPDTILRLHQVGMDQAPMTDKFSGVGIQHDDGKLLVMAEYVTRKQSTGMGDSDSMYVTGGYRIGSVMPYAVFSRFKPKGTIFALTGQTSTNNHAFGVRWDAITNLALKAQYDRTAVSTATLTTDPLFNAMSRNLHVISLSADFVF